MGLRLHGRLTTIRPATEDDVDLLVGWHADPEVSRYWDDETFTPAEIRERLERTEVDPWIVEDGGPAGRLPAVVVGAGRAARGGLDGFLVPGARGRGLMPDGASALARRPARGRLGRA